MDGCNRQLMTREELIAAAHAGRFSMALAFGPGWAGFTPRRIHTKA
jgi:organic hydroperoxide reductase OsmC/OhrA